MAIYKYYNANAIAIPPPVATIVYIYRMIDLLRSHT
jgi:hypothetical protein